MFLGQLNFFGQIGKFYFDCPKNSLKSPTSLSVLSHEREYVDYNNIRSSSYYPFIWQENGIFSSFQIAFKQVKRAHKILYVERKFSQNCGTLDCIILVVQM
jgi:hypothetical protein